ncbi:MAG: polyprenyl synthetase family protein [Micrococcales bacterium]
MSKLPKQLRKVSDAALLRQIEVGLAKVEVALEAAVSHTDPIAKVTARHLSSAGGKRVRPTLVLLTAQFGPNPAATEVIDASVVVELTHLATLYHDDVMDNAPMRRGVPSAHEIWGNSVAILTGDLLFARASQVVSRLGERAFTLQADTFERLCLGQLHETVGPSETDEPVAHYIQVLADKTGSLIAAAAELGIMFSGAPQEYRSAVREYGEAIGVAFQLIDDVIDLQSDSATSGKTPGTDLLAGVPTLPTLYLRQIAKTDDAAAALLARVDSVNEQTLASVVAELASHQATVLAFEEAKRWSRDAIAALEPLPNTSAKQAMIAFAEAVVDRQN